MKRLIIFDLDGTVGDTVESLAYTVNRCLKQFSFSPLPEKSFYYYAGDGARKMLERSLRAAGDKKGEYLDQIYELYCEEFKTGCTVGVKSFPGLPHVLEQLKEYGIMLAVCSNKAQQFAEAVIAKIYGEGVFDYILGERSDIPRKPDPAGPLHIAEELGVTPDECIYVGDTNTDMRTGLAAEMYTVGVTWGFRPRKELEEFHPDRIIDRPEELLELNI